MAPKYPTLFILIVMSSELCYNCWYHVATITASLALFTAHIYVYERPFGAQLLCVQRRSGITRAESEINVCGTRLNFPHANGQVLHLAVHDWWATTAGYI